jgi:thioredoxin reductase
MPTTDTVIIGAGPYGLSLAAHLSAADVPHHILGQPMQAWKEVMPPGMLMRSEAFASSLNAPTRQYTVEEYFRLHGLPYQRVGMHFPLETFVDYALWFQKNLVGHVRPVDVCNMQHAEGMFHLSLSDGTSLAARRVVIALGLKGFEQSPAVLQGLPKQYVSHSGIYGRLSWAREKDIVIVGGGQSALGLAALFHETGARIRVLVREPSLTWNSKPDHTRGVISRLMSPEGGLGAGWRSHIISEYPFLFRMLDRQRRKRMVETSWGPSGAWWLRDRVADKIEVLLGSEVRHACVENDRVILRVKSENGESTLAADHVIAATGFKTDIRRYGFLSREIIDSMSAIDGVPELTHDFESNMRGLYIIGPASAYSFGPAMRFIYGSKYAAPRVTRHIARSCRKDARKPLNSASVAGDPAVDPVGQ